MKIKLILFFFFASCLFVHAQQLAPIKWAADGNSYYQIEGNEIVQIELPSKNKKVLVSKSKLIPIGKDKPIAVNGYQFNADYSKVLIFTNTMKVWRFKTRGDYWVLDLKSGTLTQLGKSLPTSSLMFAKFSPDGSKVGYVSRQNIYIETLGNPGVRALTTAGSRRNIYGTFDWVYEEEFGTRDGFRWSPDGTKIAFWHVDATKIRDIPLINNTDSIAPFVVPVEYPLVGEPPSPVRIGVIDLATGGTVWVSIPGEPHQNYLPRMEWAANSSELIVQQFNRKQTETTLYICNAQSGKATPIYNEKSDVFINCKGQLPEGNVVGWDWLNNGKEFLWASEKDGWMHLYRISRDGKSEKIITPGNYDISKVDFIDDKNNTVYFTASPDNTLRRALYKTKMDGKGKLERVSPIDQPGTHLYEISPTGLFARHIFSNHYTEPVSEFVRLAQHVPLEGESIIKKMKESEINKKTEFFTVTTSEGVKLDGWMVKPSNFDPAKKYPVVFFVYGEPASTTVLDYYNISDNFLYDGDMAKDGYIYISLDNRGTPSLKGREWRTSIYKKIGTVNVRDQALGAQEVLKWSFVDSDRTAVWGWSGGANTTLHLLGQYPDLFKTGIAIASAANLLTYDNIYTERYMGLPQENMDAYVKGSPLTFVKNIKANLLYIHGTGDDNVHYQNAELLLNEFIKYNKQVRFMAYPNRTHSIQEGEGTYQHLSTLYTNYLKEHCPPGGK